MVSFGPTDLVLHLIVPPYTQDDPRLVEGEVYVGLAYESWRVGPMRKVWYGWLWQNEHGPGTQANHIDGPLYRFDPEQHISAMYHKPPPPMMDCPHCGESIPFKVGLCPECGVLNE